MPIPIAIGAAAIGAGGGILNSLSQTHQNKKSRQFAKSMYEQQYRDSIAFWNMQNEYNSPQQQMQRFQAAGLNPHLIYGQGNSGNAGPISVPDVQSPQFRSPEWGGALQTGGLMYMNAIYDLDIKQAQLDNLRAQNHVITQEAMLKRINTDRGIFDLDFLKDTRDISFDAKREGVRQMKVGTDISLSRDAREAAMNSSNIQEAVQRMLTMQEQRLTAVQSRVQSRAEVLRINDDRRRIREQVSQLKKDGVLKDLDIELRRQGINPNDPMWARIVGRFLSNVFESDGFQNTTGNIWSWIFGR